MASLRAPGTYGLWYQKPDGNRILIKEANSNFWNCSGLGSPDGVMSTTATPEKLNFLPLAAGVGGAGDSLVITYTASTATTTDASDSIGIIPLLVNGQPQNVGIDGGGGGGLGNNSFTSVLAAGDVAFVANVRTDVAIVRANPGVSFQVGGAKIFLSLEDNTA